MNDAGVKPALSFYSCVAQFFAAASCTSATASARSATRFANRSNIT